MQCAWSSQVRPAAQRRASQLSSSGQVDPPLDAGADFQPLSRALRIRLRLPCPRPGVLSRSPRRSLAPADLSSCAARAPAPGRLVDRSLVDFPTPLERAEHKLYPSLEVPLSRKVAPGRRGVRSDAPHSKPIVPSFRFRFMENQPSNETEQAVRRRALRIFNSQMSWPAIARALCRLGSQYPDVHVVLDAEDGDGGAA